MLGERNSRYNKKAGILIRPLCHILHTRTKSNRIDALNIPGSLCSACHQLWGQGQPDRKMVRFEARRLRTETIEALTSDRSSGLGRLVDLRGGGGRGQGGTTEPDDAGEGRSRSFFDRLGHRQMEERCLCGGGRNGGGGDGGAAALLISTQDSGHMRAFSGSSRPRAAHLWVTFFSRFVSTDGFSASFAGSIVSRIFSFPEKINSCPVLRAAPPCRRTPLLVRSVRSRFAVARATPAIRS